MSEKAGATVIFNDGSDMKDRGFRLKDAPLLMTGYDPAGDGSDRDAVIVAAREEWRRGELNDPDLAVEMMFRIYIAQRMKPDAEMQEKIAILLAYHRQAAKWMKDGRIAEHVMCVETNGVGYGIAATLKSKLGARVIPYVTVGNTSNKPVASNKVSMPRLASLDNLRMLLELHRIKASKDAPGLKLLHGEFNSFVWKRPGRPEALEGAKDDLVMALAGVTWIGTKVVPPLVKQQGTLKGTRIGVATSGHSNMRVQ